MAGIIWLASYPKSGNTWTRAFLHNLLRNPPKPASVNELDRFCFGESAAVWYEKIGKRKPTEMTNKEIADLRPKVHAAFTRSSPDSVFVKTHCAMVETEGVPLITMAASAGAIYVVRNPLDVVISLADHYGLDIDGAIEMMASPTGASPTDERNVFEIYGPWHRHVESWTRAGHRVLHVMRYEDMLDKPFGTFGALAGFLGLKPPRQRLDRAIKFSSFKVLQQQERKDGFRERSANSEKFFRVGRSGQWRDTLNDDQIGRIVAAHREQMQKFDYVPAGF
ncbi:MAG: sulfotransferase domain-containing protein [Alphaproteobacteria bacterium]